MADTKILLIESATDICSVGVGIGNRLVAIKKSETSFQHSERLTLLIQECMAEAGLLLNKLDAIALSGGPGSYTSLRVGASVAKGLCYALDKPLLAISSLEIISNGAREGFLGDALFCPMIDARRMEVYSAIFDSNGQALTPVQAVVVTRESYREYLDRKTVVFCGNGMPKCREIITHPNAVFSPVDSSSAAFMCAAALSKYGQMDFEDLVSYEPYYHKPPNITQPKNTL